jgi:beta-glucanase (GH16 family)
MRVGVSCIALSVAAACACAANTGRANSRLGGPPTAAPRITAVAASNGAMIIALSSATRGARLFYTVDGSRPTARSTSYETPFLVASSLTVRAVAQARGDSVSRTASRRFALDIPADTLVWSDEFNGATFGAGGREPDPRDWSYETRSETNASIDVLCAYDSSAAPCSRAHPNSFVGTDGALHILAQQPATGIYTSARINTRGRFSFQYGRLEARIWVPEGQGIWPAFWLLGDSCSVVGWPACGEIDVMERINWPGSPPAGMEPSPPPPQGTSDWNKGSIHGTGFIGNAIGALYYFKGGATAAGWHTYGVIKTPDRIEFYIDDRKHPYAAFTPASIAPRAGAVWPFDDGQSFYIILNIAVGGDWPGAPDAGTHFPSTMLVDYVRLYTN